MTGGSARGGGTGGTEDDGRPVGQPPKGEASTAWEDQGSIPDRLGDTATDGSEVPEDEQREAADVAARGGGVRTDDDSRKVAHTEGGMVSASTGEATNAAGTDPHAVGVDLQAGEDSTHGHPRTPAQEKKAELLVTLCFLGTAVCSVAFVLVFGLLDPAHAAFTPLLGTFLGLALSLIGVGAVLWGKKLMVDEEAVQLRHIGGSSDEERKATLTSLAEGGSKANVGRRPVMLGAIGLGFASMALPAIAPLLALGPKPQRELYTTRWKKGSRLVRANGEPINVAELKIGSVETVFPEGHPRASDSSTLLIRLRPDEHRPRPGREDWAVDGYVAYSKICTHAGCPVGLYEQQTHHLLCPCHQSTFDVTDGCRVIFGPAARSLPQLAITLDDDGYFVAQGDYNEPVGPSFWERG